MVQDPQWDEWLKGKKYRIDGDNIAAALLSTRHWKRIRHVLQLIAPIYVLLRLTDRQAPVMSKIYFRCFQLQEHFTNPDIVKVVHKMFMERCVILSAGQRHDACT